MSTIEIDKASGVDRPTQTKILSKEERAAIAESLRARDIDFGLFPYPNGRDTTRLEPFRDRIESVALPAIAKIADELPIKNVHIGVFDAPEAVIPELGNRGQAHGYEIGKKYSQVEVDLDPESEHRETAMGEDLERTLRHELYHDARMDALGEDGYRTLLDVIVFDGLATQYEIEGSNDEPSPYAVALTPDQIPVLLAKARKDFSKVFTSEDISSRDEWYWGSEEKNIPKWTVYALGHYLVGEYLKAHPGAKASTLYAIPAEEFIKSFDENHKK